MDQIDVVGEVLEMVGRSSSSTVADLVSLKIINLLKQSMNMRTNFVPKLKGPALIGMQIGREQTRIGIFQSQGLTFKCLVTIPTYVYTANGKTYVGEEAKTHGRPIFLTDSIGHLEPGIHNEVERTVQELADSFIIELVKLTKPHIKADNVEVFVALPDAFKGCHHDIIKKAIQNSGWNVVEMCSEAVAASVHHGITNQPGVFKLVVLNVGSAEIQMAGVESKFGILSLIWNERYDLPSTEGGFTENDLNIITTNIHKIVSKKKFAWEELKMIVFVGDRPDFQSGVEQFASRLNGQEKTFYASEIDKAVVAGAAKLAIHANLDQTLIAKKGKWFEMVLKYLSKLGVKKSN